MTCLESKMSVLMSASKEEPMKVKIKRDVNVYDEYIDDTPDFAYVEIDEKFIDEIFRLHKVMKENKIDKIANYDYTPEYMLNELDENGDETGNEIEADEFRTECEMLNIIGNSIYWSFLVKHTNAQGEVTGFDIKTLKKYKEVMNMPVENLPTLINDEDEAIQSIAKERMSVPAC